MLESQLTSMSEHFDKLAVNELAGGLHAGVPDAVHRGDESNLRQRGERGAARAQQAALPRIAKRGRDKCGGGACDGGNGLWLWLAQVPALFEIILPHALKMRRHCDCLTAKRESAGLHLLPWALAPLCRCRRMRLGPSCSRT